MINGGIKMTETRLDSKKKIILAVAVLVAVAVLFGVVYAVFGPKGVSGDKTLTIEVTDDAGTTTTYTVDTDAEYLRQALEETEGLSVEGTESEYGLMVDTVNGLTADYSTNGAYWAFYVDDAYCEYGIDTQPVEDGQTYQIVYTLAE